MSTRNKLVFLAGVLAILGGLVAIQFWPGARDFPREPVVSEPDWNDPYTRELAERACFDCHSNETNWPWYTLIVPFSLMIQRDVREGREVLNFSEWESTCCTEQLIDDMAETVGKDIMPLPYYKVLHPEALLSDAERGHLVNGLIETMNKNLPEPMAEPDES